MKVLHVTEASGAGVLASLAALARSQVQTGIEVEVAIILRKDSPSEVEIKHMLGPKVELILLNSRGMNARSANELLYLLVRRVLSENAPNFIHYHSTYAGVIGRLVSLFLLRSSKSFYSPHGFAFLRQDISAWKRNLIKLLERVLHFCGSTMIVVSPSERAAAIKTVGKRRIEVLENGIDIDSLPRHTGGSPRNPVALVGTAARIAHQKAPWKFAQLAQEMGNMAHFRWIGSGDATDREKWLGQTKVEVTGWLSPQESVLGIADLDIYVSTALWEGLPMSVIQAQAIGIPCVVSAADGHPDIVQDGVTGYVCNSTEEMLERIRDLAADPLLRASMGGAARRVARKRFNSERLGPQSKSIYTNERR